MQSSDYEIAELTKQEQEELTRLENTFREKIGKNVVLIAWETGKSDLQTSGKQDL